MIDKRILLLFFTFVLLNGLDVLTTIIGLEIGAAEANPTAQRLMNSLGLAEAMMLKFLLILVLGIASLTTYWFACNKEQTCLPIVRTILTVVFVVGIFAYLYVVCSNIYTIWLQINFYS